MKVYVVLADSAYGFFWDAVFSTNTLAEDYIERMDDSMYREIEEQTVDEEVK